MLRNALNKMIADVFKGTRAYSVTLGLMFIVVCHPSEATENSTLVSPSLFLDSGTYDDENSKHEYKRLGLNISFDRALSEHINLALVAGGSQTHWEFESGANSDSDGFNGSLIMTAYRNDSFAELSLSFSRYAETFESLPGDAQFKPQEKTETAVSISVGAGFDYFFGGCLLQPSLFVSYGEIDTDLDARIALNTVPPRQIDATETSASKIWDVSAGLLLAYEFLQTEWRWQPYTSIIWTEVLDGEEKLERLLETGNRNLRHTVDSSISTADQMDTTIGLYTESLTGFYIDLSAGLSHSDDYHDRFVMSEMGYTF